MFPLGYFWPVGDSVTYGTGGLGGCGWRDGMHAQNLAWGGTLVGTQTGGTNFATCPISGLALKSDGWPGYTCEQVTSFAPSWFSTLSGTPPSIVTLLIGFNSLIQVLLNARTMNQIIADFEATLSTVIALTPASKFFVGTIPNCSIGALAIPFNDGIARAVEAHKRAGVACYLVDFWPVLTPVVDYDGGGLHPNYSTGYPKMATKWATAIRTLQP